MNATQQTISPVDGRLYAERNFADAGEVDAVLSRAVAAQARWAALEISESEGAQAVPARLKSLGESVARSAEVLERLAFEERARREKG